MVSCDHCRERIWDDLFGLLEAGDSASLRRHVAACSACQTEMATAVAQHKLVAEAARLDVELPRFTAPVVESAQPFFHPPRLENAVVMRRVRVLPWLAAAAAVLLLIGLPFGLYQYGRLRYEAAWQAAEDSLGQIVGQRQELQSRAQTDRENLLRVAHAKYLRLQVIGPAAYQAGAVNPYRVWVTDVAGQPVDAPVTARLLHAGKAVVLQTKKSRGKGEWLLELPADLPLGPESTHCLELAARDQDDLAPVRAYLRVLEPAYRTHLTTDKSVYHPGETIYFRSLTLERFGLKVPHSEFTATYTLADAKGTEFQTLRGLTRNEGSGGGAFDFSPNWPAGEYTLTVTEPEKRFPPISRRIWIRPPASGLRKALQFDRASYKPGETVRAHLQLEHHGGGSVADLPVTVSVEVNGRAAGTRREYRTDARGNASLHAQLPDGLSGPARLIVVVNEREQAETMTRAIPVTFDSLEVDFFPEGGDLVSGVDNRIYFRVRTPLGQPADLQGAIVDSQDREVVAVQTYQLAGQPASNRGLGTFTLRPRVGETYKLRIRSPEGVDVRAQLPPVQTTGLALSLPAAVVGPEEPIRAVLQQTGPERHLVVGLFCQGRLVAQELVAAKSGSTEVRLTPVLACSGVMRVTVFEERHGQLWPLAEHLAFRRPRERLVLSVKADKEGYAAGEKVKLNIRSLDEKGKPEPAWVMVAVVDQAALSRSTSAAETSLPAYFHLTSELQEPEDLEQAGILLGDSPEAATALDLFLGTQGWRRFAEQEAETALVMGNSGAARRAQDMAVPAIVKLDNLEQVEREVANDLNQAADALKVAVTKRDQELVREGNERLQVAATAARELDAFEDRTGELIRLLVGLGGVLLIAVACPLLVIALLRLARGLAPNRAYLAGAFAALLVCALIVWGQAGRWERTSDPTSLSLMAKYGEKLHKPFDLAGIVLPHNKEVASSRAPSKGRGPLPQEASGKHLATLKPNEEVDTADQRKKPGPGSPPRPFIGSIVGSSPKSPAPPNKNAPASPLPVREYAYGLSKGPTSGSGLPETILWQPILFADDGTAEVNFRLPPKAATYRICVQGHNAAGRLGAVQEKLECRQNAAGVTK